MYSFNSESFALNWYILVALTNKKLLLPLQYRLNPNPLFIGYIASVVNVISSNPYVGPSPSIKISFPFLSICTDELISAPKIF